MSDPLATLPKVVCAFGEGYFVGGCVRDWLMGRRLKDVDLVVTAEPWKVGKAIADPLGAHLFWLREEQRVARVLLPGKDALQVDLQPLATSLEEDLRARDFTVNAMAVPVAEGLVPGARVLDPTGGRADLERRLLRLVGPETLTRDPLRMLRAVRLSEQLRFRLASETEREVRARAELLPRVSRERIRDELFLMLERGHAARALTRLRSLGLLAVMLPESASLTGERWSVVPERVRALRRLRTSAALPLSLRRRLRMVIVAPRPRIALLSWGCLLDPTRPGAQSPSSWARETATRFALGAREASLLSALLREQEAATALLREVVTAGRDLYGFVRRAEGWAAEVLVFAAAGADTAVTSQSLGRVLQGVVRQEAQIAAPLLSGTEVMALCDLKAGPAVGRALEALAEARAEGVIRTPEEAREWLKGQVDCLPMGNSRVFATGERASRGAQR